MFNFNFLFLNLMFLVESWVYDYEFVKYDGKVDGNIIEVICCRII